MHQKLTKFSIHLWLKKKTLQKVGIERTNLNIKKAIYDKPTANTMFSWKAENISSKIRNMSVLYVYSYGLMHCRCSRHICQLNVGHSRCMKIGDSHEEPLLLLPTGLSDLSGPSLPCKCRAPAETFCSITNSVVTSLLLALLCWVSFRLPPFLFLPLGLCHLH